MSRPIRKTRTKNSKLPSTKDNYTQTDNEETEVQILQKKLIEYETRIAFLEGENNALRSHCPNDYKNINLSSYRNTSFSSLKNSPKSASKLKGCGCKGNCSTKICGCVKKNSNCSEFCKCNDARCRNQEPDKENINNKFDGNLTNEAQDALEKLSNLSLAQASAVKAQGSCPFTSPMSVNSRRQLFHQNSDDFIDVGCAESDTFDNEQVCKKKTLSNKENLCSTPKTNQSFVVDIDNITHRNNKNTEIMRARVQHSPSNKNNEIISNWVQEAKNLLSSPNGSKNKNDISSFEQEESQKNISIDELDLTLNPMVPKRQLARSPINAAGLMVATDSKHFSPPKKEWAQEEVNWDEHQANLVECPKCKRRFFPFRIEKHMISCKKI